MAEDLNDLFEGPDDSSQAAPVPTTPEPEPSAGYTPSMEGLAQEIGQLKQIVQALLPALQRGQQQGPGGAFSPPLGSPPSRDTLSYKDQEYLDEAGANALLSSPNVRGELNTMLNKTARQVHTDLAAEIARDRAAFSEFRATSQQAEQYRQVSQQMQSDFSDFYGKHRNLEQHAELVMLEAQNMAREYNQNPYVFTGITREGIMKSLADRTQRRISTIAASVSGQPGLPPSSRLPARRTQVERGSGSRIGIAPGPKDANQKELEDMDRFVRG